MPITHLLRITEWNQKARTGIVQILKVHLKKEVLRSEIFLVRLVCGIYPKGNSGGRYHAGAYISCERLWPNVKKRRIHRYWYL